MPNYFFTDANGQKWGPINDLQLRTLVTQKKILPNTPMETDTGRKCGDAAYCKKMDNST